MKKMSHFARKLLGGGALLALLAMAANAVAENVPQYITVTYVKGQARYTTDNKTWHALKKGDVLSPGCVIQTADRSIVDVLLGDKKGSMEAASPVPARYNNPLGSGGIGAPPGGGPKPGASGGVTPKSNIVRIMENTYLGVDKLMVDQTGVDTVSDTQLDLRAGQIMGTVKKLSGASKYEIKIPNGVAGIRGTTYLISSAGVVDVLSGSVMVAIVAADGTVTTRLVTAGNSFDPSTGQITPIPPDVLTQLNNIYRSLHGANPTGPTSYPKDQSVIYISPN